MSILTSLVDSSSVTAESTQTITGAKTFTGTTQINTLNIGASGTVGALQLFPTTASKGKWVISPVDNTGNTALTLTNAAQSGAWTYTIPDAGASCSFVMTAGTQTVSATNTFSGSNSFTGAVTHGGVVPASATLTPAAGGTNICLVTIQLKDASGTNLATSRMIDVWLSAASTGIGLTGVTASGNVVAGHIYIHL
jgi:hypothetical protein